MPSGVGDGVVAALGPPAPMTARDVPVPRQSAAAPAIVAILPLHLVGVRMRPPRFGAAPTAPHLSGKVWQPETCRTRMVADPSSPRCWPAWIRGPPTSHWPAVFAQPMHNAFSIPRHRGIPSRAARPQRRGARRRSKSFHLCVPGRPERRHECWVPARRHSPRDADNGKVPSHAHQAASVCTVGAAVAPLGHPEYPLDAGFRAEGRILCAPGLRGQPEYGLSGSRTRRHSGSLVI